MIAKGLVSAISGKKAAVILPEYDSVTTGFLPIYTQASKIKLKVNDFVLVVFFNEDMNDGIVLMPHGEVLCDRECDGLCSC